MTTYKEKAEAYVRQQLPELYNPLHSICSKHQDTLQYECNLCQTGWMSPQLQHWLRVLVLAKDTRNVAVDLSSKDNVLYYEDEISHQSFRFNLTTGQPATQADYKAFCEIVGINQD